LAVTGLPPPQHRLELFGSPPAIVDWLYASNCIMINFGRDKRNIGISLGLYALSRVNLFNTSATPLCSMTYPNTRSWAEK